MEEETIPTKEEVLNKEIYWRRAVLIAGISGRLTFRQIAHIIKDLETSRYFQKMMQFLDKNDFITIDSSRQPYFIKVKQSKLANFLWDGMSFKYAEKIIELTSTVYAY